MALFLATRNGGISGRVAAIEDRAHNEFHHERLAWFGFFEARTAAAGRALLAAGERWGRPRGCPGGRGPANPWLNENAGPLDPGFLDDPRLLMSVNSAPAP